MNSLDQKIFKAYDIRGVYPGDLNEDISYLVGQAYALKTKAKKVVVGRDMRIGSQTLSENLIKGLVDQGVMVDDIGLVSIDAVYFCVGKYDYDGGIMITASHNPKEYNGIKMAFKGEGVEFIRGIELYEFMRGKVFKPKEKKGLVQKKDIMVPYIEHVLSFADINKIKPFKVVVDAGNGMAGKVVPLLFEKLPCQLIPLNFKLDGNFPAHPSNPLLPESRQQIAEAVVKEGADFGVIFDGDTDRLFFVTEKGEFIQADTTLLILAKCFLENNPGVGIAYNVICSKAVPERVKEWGGRPLRSAVGFVNVSNAAKKGNGIMGGEVSAHYSFRDNFFADSGFIAFVIFLKLISEEDKKLSEIVKGLNPYFKSDEVNIEIQDTSKVVAEVKKKYSDGKHDKLDGITVEYPDWWFNVRPSNTEPLVRITVEGNTKEIMEREREKLIEFIKKVHK